jgi:hypothetical protein
MRSVAVTPEKQGFFCGLCIVYFSSQVNNYCEEDE